MTRKLTLLGKIAVIKSLAVSQAVYVLSSLPTPRGALKEINSSLYEFLWDNKGDKKRTEIVNDYDKGGLKMIDIQSFNESLKLKWVQGHLNDNQGKCSNRSGLDLRTAKTTPLKYVCL